MTDARYSSPYPAARPVNPPMSVVNGTRLRGSFNASLSSSIGNGEKASTFL